MNIFKKIKLQKELGKLMARDIENRKKLDALLVYDPKGVMQGTKLAAAEIGEQMYSDAIDQANIFLQLGRNDLYQAEVVEMMRIKNLTGVIELSAACWN